MDYQLTKKDNEKREPLWISIRKLANLMTAEKRQFYLASIAIVCNSLASLSVPIIIGYTIDHAVASRDYTALLINATILLVISLFGWVMSYLQTRMMGGIGRRTLYRLRNALFDKISSLPISFFNQNKIGDLTSRITSDTDKLNQFFAQAFTQFLGNLLLVVGAGVCMLILSVELGAVALLPALVVLLLTRLLSPWVQRKNLKSLQTTGAMSAEIQESLANFPVVVAFNRMDYFEKKFDESNTKNYHASVWAGMASGVFSPLYSLASNLAQLLVLVFAITMILSGHIAVGLFVSFQLYLTNFYSPLQQLASVWSSFQLALASLDRIYEVLSLESNMPIIPSEKTKKTNDVLVFENVSFGYESGKDVLSHINLSLEKGKTYALVGPTGGGKTTTAMLLARLYDPREGVVWLE